MFQTSVSLGLNTIWEAAWISLIYETVIRSGADYSIYGSFLVEITANNLLLTCGATSFLLHGLHSTSVTLMKRLLSYSYSSKLRYSQVLILWSPTGKTTQFARYQPCPSKYIAC